MCETPNTQAAPAAYQILLIQAIDAASLGHSCIDDLAALFTAIRDASEEASTARGLASIGCYLAHEWADLFDLQHEQLVSLREARP